MSWEYSCCKKGCVTETSKPTRQCLKVLFGSRKYPPHPTEGHWKFQWGGESKAIFLRENMKLNLEFPWVFVGRGVQTKKTFCGGGMGILLNSTFWMLVGYPCMIEIYGASVIWKEKVQICAFRVSPPFVKLIKQLTPNTHITSGHYRIDYNKTVLL